MNARGKQLSKYENLKSFIEKDSKISKDQKLLENMDTNWSDYFFDSKNPEVFDIRGCNFLHYATLFFVLEREIESKNIKEAIENPSQPINEFYEPLQNIENIKLLDRVVNLCRSFHSLGINEDLKLKNSSFFNKNKTLSYSDICYFFSILFFMKENGEVEKIDKSAFNDYLRVCRHFIENHRLDNPEDHIPFFKLFKHLSQEYENIYQFLIDNPTYEFHKNIYTLEVKKAKLILDSREGGENWEKILNKTSEHKILKGWVDFLLDFSDEKFDFKSYEKQSELKQPNLHKFQQYADITMQILDKEGFLDKNLTLFQRAFLCIGHFGFYNRNYFYGNSPYDNFRDREALNWILKGSKNSSKLPYFKKFLDTLLECKGENLIDKMQEVIKKTDLSQKEWWEQLLIGEEALFDFLNEKKEAFQGYRRIRYWDMKGKDKVKIELLPGLSNTTNVKDLLDYGFYCYCKDRYSSRVSMYECGEKQYGDKFELLPHFSLDNMKVLCNSMESKICFDDKEYPINLEKGSNIFNEFGRILKLIDEDRVIK